MSKTARIAKFEVNNMMAVRFAEVEFDESGGLVVIGGPNGSGKSSLIEALQFALGGKKAIDKDPLRYGADKGFVNVTLSGVDFQIRRTINEKGGETLTVKRDGKRVDSPQTVLNEFMGAIGIDPSAIFKMDDSTIANTLRNAMGLNLSDLDEKENELYAHRTQANRAVKHSQKAVEDAPTFHGVPDKPISFTQLLAELDNAEEQNNRLERVSREQGENAERRQEIPGEIAELERQIETLRNEQAELNSRAAELREIVENTEEINIEEIRSRMSQVEETNEKIAANDHFKFLQGELEKDQEYARKLDTEIKAVRQEKIDRIKAVEFPLQGVTFDHEGKLILDGKPWKAWSDGERLLASFEIAAAMSPNLRAVVMRQGAWLDDESRKVVADIASERDYLVLMEIVGDSNEVALYMDDGQVKDRR